MWVSLWEDLLVQKLALVMDSCCQMVDYLDIQKVMQMDKLMDFLLDFLTELEIMMDGLMENYLARLKCHLQIQSQYHFSK